MTPPAPSGGDFDRQLAAIAADIAAGREGDDERFIDLIAAIETLEHFTAFVHFLGRNAFEIFQEDQELTSSEYVHALGGTLRDGGQSPALPRMKSDLSKVAWAIYFSLCVS